MWHAMSPPQITSNGQTTTIPNGDGSSTVYVHHISHGASAPQAPQTAPLPQQTYPMPMPYPYPMQAPPYPYPPAPSSYGSPFQQQPTVIIMNADAPKDDKKKKKKEKPKDEPKDEEAAPPPPPPEPEPEEEREPPPSEPPQKMSKFSIVSLVMLGVAFIFGTACIIELNQAEDARLEGNLSGEELSEYNEYSSNRTVSLSLGCVSSICFTVATLLSFYAGMRHKAKATGKKHCCLSAFLLASWIIFVMTTLIDLIIFVMAFNPQNVIYPEAVLISFLGSLFSWMLMFGHSEIARKADYTGNCCTSCNR